jgi:hypothetical protein
MKKKGKYFTTLFIFSHALRFYQNTSLCYLSRRYTKKTPCSITFLPRVISSEREKKKKKELQSKFQFGGESISFWRSLGLESRSADSIRVCVKSASSLSLSLSLSSIAAWSNLLFNHWNDNANRNCKGRYKEIG